MPQMYQRIANTIHYELYSQMLDMMSPNFHNNALIQFKIDPVRNNIIMFDGIRLHGSISNNPEGLFLIHIPSYTIYRVALFNEGDHFLNIIKVKNDKVKQMVDEILKEIIDDAMAD